MAQELDFPEKSFDAVITTEVLEHFPKKTSVQMLSKAEKWANRKVVITVPNGFLAQPGASWYAVSGLSQLFVYFFPELAYGLFCVKEIKSENYSK